MSYSEKKTRNCIEPWRSVQFDAAGNVSPCCSGTISGSFGNIVSDVPKTNYGENSGNLFSNQDYQRLRHGLLTGELSLSCKSCRAVHDEDITPDDLRKRVINHLRSQGINTDGVDLTKEFSFSECGGNITNRCNFSCIYCSHSGENGHSGFLKEEMGKEQFLSVIDFLYQKGLRIFNFCGIGELTTYPDWKDLCQFLLENYPLLRLRIISNFGKRFTDSELETLSKFDLIHVSCDTLDADTYAWLRKGGKLSVLLDNIYRLKNKFTGNLSFDPKLVFNVTATDIIIYKLEDLFRYAAKQDMFIHLSTLFVMEGSIASKTDCVQKITNVSNLDLPRVREIFYDLPRRMKAENPLTGIWEYKFLYNSIMEKADEITFNRFVPNQSELVYDIFYKTNQKNIKAFLRKLWLSFDVTMKGIFFEVDEKVKIELPTGIVKICYRIIWCKDRMDGDIEVLLGDIENIEAKNEVSVFASCSNKRYSHAIFEVLSCELIDEAKEIIKEVQAKPPLDITNSFRIREAFLSNEEEIVAKRIVESMDPIVIWCAGLRTLQLLSNTSLGKANIKMIIDGNPSKKGELFCGYEVLSPSDLGDFLGKIVVIHASCPEQVEKHIRTLGIKNEIIIL